MFGNLWLSLTSDIKPMPIPTKKTHAFIHDSSKLIPGVLVGFDSVLVLVHEPEQISVPSGWAKLGNVFYVHICPVQYLSHYGPLKLAAFMWLSSIFNILFSKNSIFVFFDDFQIIFKLRPSSMTVLIKHNCSNTSWYPFKQYVSISLKKMRKLW